MEFPNYFISAGHDYADFDHPVAAPYLRKSFYISKTPAKAELVITGLGFYRVFLNGVEITKSILAPYISNPDDLVYYDAYSVAERLQPGENVIGVQLGNGMQNCFGGYVWDFEKAKWRGAPKMAMRLDIEQADGSAVTLESDETFRTHSSPLIMDDLRCGEYYDARMEMDGWCSAGFDDSSWGYAVKAKTPRGECRLCTASPIVASERLSPVSITPYQEGYLYDFGVNAAGVCQLKIQGSRPGQEIFTSYCEWFHDGILEQRNLNFADRGDPRSIHVQCNRYICRGLAEEAYTPAFAFYGFRYVYVKGVTAEQAVPELLTYQVIHGDFHEVGSFSCSDEVANTLQQLTRRSDLANFFWFPTDCPHREKNGWTGDAALSAEHMLINLSVEDSLREWMRNISAAQNAEGALPGIVPTGGWGFAWGNGPAWDQVLVELPYQLYRLRGDLDTARENGASILRYLQYISHRRDARGLVAIGLGDWCPPSRRPDDPKSPLEVTDTAICMDISVKSALLFERLGWELERQFALELYDQLRTAFRKYLIDFSTMTVAGDCQTSQVVGLYYQIFEPGERAAAFARLKKLIAECDEHFDCGIIGLRGLFHVLSDFEETDLAFKMITRLDYPSYGNWVARGATSLWEVFQPEDGGAWPVYSMNHHFFGDISSWFIQRVAGIRPNPRAEDAQEILVAPGFVDSLSFAEAAYEAPAGKVQVRWEKQGSDVMLKVKVAGELHGCIQLPAGWKFADGLCAKKLASGEYGCHYK